MHSYLASGALGVLQACLLKSVIFSNLFDGLIMLIHVDRVFVLRQTPCKGPEGPQCERWFELHQGSLAALFVQH